MASSGPPPARTRRRRPIRSLLAVGAATAALTVAASATAAGKPFVNSFKTVSQVASTVPRNGDVNPYGTFVVPRSTRNLTRGDVLVSNFNDSANRQGTGTTIVEISPGGHRRTFAHIPRRTCASSGGVGLTTALVALRSGFVVVGSLPTSDGSSTTAKAGCLIVLDSRGHVVETFAGSGIDGPWDMTAADDGSHATLFVTNVLNGTVQPGANPMVPGSVVMGGTVLRVKLHIPSRGRPHVTSTRVIASGLAERTDPSALVLGPTGVALGRGGTLYVADTVMSRIAAIPSALTRSSAVSGGQTVSSNGSLNAPLGLALAPNGDILTVNGGDGNLVETRPAGQQVATRPITAAGGGALFGLAVVPKGRGIYFVNDADNTLKRFH